MVFGDGLEKPSWNWRTVKFVLVLLKGSFPSYFTGCIQRVLVAPLKTADPPSILYIRTTSVDIVLTDRSQSATPSSGGFLVANAAHRPSCTVPVVPQTFLWGCLESWIMVLLLAAVFITYWKQKIQTGAEWMGLRWSWGGATTTADTDVNKCVFFKRPCCVFL